jgi:hypothetical protein
MTLGTVRRGVIIDGSRSLDCLNEKLRRDAGNTMPQPNVAPLNSQSPDVKLGIVNIPALKQQYGRNYGTSVIPYRPELPGYGPASRR